MNWNGVYCPDQADHNYHNRRKMSRKPVKLTSSFKLEINDLLQKEWSPEQISGYGRRHNLFSISHESIYQYLLADKKLGGKLYLHLRHGKKKYRKRYGSSKRTAPIKNRTMIDARPQIVEEKQRIGDWEIDTIVGKNNQSAIVTLVERVSKKTLIGMPGNKLSEFVSNQTIQMLLPIKACVFTITADNGTEFAQHELIASALDAKVYFAHPYHSWERGLNENTNGLIRQYIPKKSDFRNLTAEDIINVQNKLNDRPRKSLDYATPNEVFDKLYKQVATQ